MCLQQPAVVPAAGTAVHGQHHQTEDFTWYVYLGKMPDTFFTNVAVLSLNSKNNISINLKKMCVFVYVNTLARSEYLFLVFIRE